MIPFLLALAAQADRLPPANPLPYQDPDAAAVMAPITAMLAAIGRGDGAGVLAVTLPEGAATVVEAGATPRRRTLRWADFAGGLRAGSRVEERLGEPAIEVDGDIAMVWAPYTVRVNGAVAHCGYDHFDLVREGVGWRVLNVTWSQRTTGCGR